MWLVSRTNCASKMAPAHGAPTIAKPQIGNFSSIRPHRRQLLQSTLCGPTQPPKKVFRRGLLPMPPAKRSFCADHRPEHVPPPERVSTEMTPRVGLDGRKHRVPRFAF